tara:strand:+ start:2197 stop:2928 length:732 start_codon:yes stop_codon:yes gene_type:complete
VHLLSTFYQKNWNLYKLKKIIIFDLDNTFYNYEEVQEVALKSVFTFQDKFKKYNEFNEQYQIAREEVKNKLGGSTSVNNRVIYFKTLLENIGEKDLSIALNYENVYWENFIKNANLNNELIKKIRNEKKEGYIYHLYTNLDTNTQLKKINYWNLDFFDKIVTSEEAGYEKPHEKFIEYVTKDLDKFKKENYKFYAIGDSVENDLRPWKILYDAETYLINNESDSKYVDCQGTFENCINKIIPN